MSADWQIGDLAVCVDIGPMRFNGRLASHENGSLELGRAYRVSAVLIRADAPWCGVHCLRLVELPKLSGVSSARFRKIRPDEREACEPEFQALLKRSKRKVSA